MSGTPFDPAAQEAKVDCIFFGQLTIITNRLNSHGSRLTCMEMGKPSPGKGGTTEPGGKDDHHDEDSEEHDDRSSERDRAWEEFRDRSLRDWECYFESSNCFNCRDSGCYVRNYYGRDSHDYDDHGDRGRRL